MARFKFTNETLLWKEIELLAQNTGQDYANQIFHLVLSSKDKMSTRTLINCAISFKEFMKEFEAFYR